MKLKEVIIFILLFSLFSCNQENLDTGLKKGNDVKNETLIGEISEADAKQVLLRYLERESKTKAGVTSSDLEVITNIQKVNYNLSQNSAITKSARNSVLPSKVNLYNFTFTTVDNTQGYALISSDIRLAQVVAYIPHGTLNDTIFNKGLAYWYNNILSDILTARLDLYNKDVSQYQRQSLNAKQQNIDGLLGKKEGDC